ncbi:MAG TPA: pyrrolysine--tRNA(Pyl) ligase large subunit [Anaerovoracaceae bacterium]|nr:pyrrolysine--tRNA(Pyl) ligase large subunit [Anaerovoracaceae bacterium]
MAERFTTTQIQRLVELNAEEEIIEQTFEAVEDRNQSFKTTEARLVKSNKEKINKLLQVEHKPLVVRIEERIKSCLTQEEGFTQVTTPTIITAAALEKMTITKEHPLTNQVFWLDPKRCLRPMLAPNLYEVMRDLHKITKEPVKIFEAGSCFRKESQGAQHMNEFTMLNLVELASVEEGQQMERLQYLAKSAMKAIGIDDYELVIEKSEVYGETMDIVVDGLELASGAYGPHFLDSKWGVFDPWVGIGFGIERIAMKMANYQTIKRVGKSLVFIDGSPLNL